jgi:Fe-S cluster biogenesis protein NfuA|eukprot:gene4722-3385_t
MSLFASSLAARRSAWIGKTAAVFRQQCRGYLQEEKTPNPSAIKFLFPAGVLPESHGTGLFFERSKKPTAREMARSPLAKKLLDVDVVESVFLGRDFITVTKDKKSRWKDVKARIIGPLFEFEDGRLKAVADLAPGEDDAGVHSDTKILETDTEVVAAIKELIESRVRPSVQEDGGDIFFVDFLPATGVVQVRLAGSCVGCPSSSVTLRHGVENMLMHYIPEVKGIEEVSALVGSGDACDAHVDGNAAGDELKLSFAPPTPASS